MKERNEIQESINIVTKTDLAAFMQYLKTLKTWIQKQIQTQFMNKN